MICVILYAWSYDRYINIHDRYIWSIRRSVYNWIWYHDWQARVRTRIYDRSRRILRELMNSFLFSWPIPADRYTGTVRRPSPCRIFRILIRTALVRILFGSWSVMHGSSNERHLQCIHNIYILPLLTCRMRPSYLINLISACTNLHSSSLYTHKMFMGVKCWSMIPLSSW